MYNKYMKKIMLVSTISIFLFFIINNKLLNRTYLNNIYYKTIDSYYDFKYNESNDDRYELLTKEDLLFKNTWYPTIDSFEIYLAKKAEIKRMQTLADYISKKYNKKLFQTEEIIYISYVEGKKQNLSPILLLSLIAVESGYNKNIYSKAGAVGLTQVIPFYHKDKITNLQKNNLSIISIKGNIKLGTTILKEYINLSHGNVKLALQKYNGAANDKKQKYSKKILKSFDELNKIYHNAY